MRRAVRVHWARAAGGTSWASSTWPSATRDVEATHRFYTEAMGFELMKVEVGKTDGGWAKHLFYSTGEPRADRQFKGRIEVR